MSDHDEQTRWALERALPVAEKIRAELAPYCTRIVIAGSVRRRRPLVGDLDLVLIIKDGARRDLLDRVTGNTNTRLEKNGEDIVIFRLANGLQVDLYLAKAPVEDLGGSVPGNWGMRLLAMTGSKEHNVMLAQRAKEMGLHFAPYRGLLHKGSYVNQTDGSSKYVGGEVLASETEEEIFQALGLDYVTPEKREI